MSRASQLYRHLLRAARSMEGTERDDALKAIREGFRNSKKNISEEETKKLLEIGQNKLSYIKMVTPRRPQGQSGKSSFIMGKDGKLVEGTTTIAGRTQRAGIFPDDLKRHHQLLERQHFGLRR
mmetsp:Transcript_17259/g.30413  ORF Transcript_17259/g.30413 Transcript_17259/m.30413 type:complete len:123 (+) Transcript_17259:205-573(+)